MKNLFICLLAIQLSACSELRGPLGAIRGDETKQDFIARTGPPLSVRKAGARGQYDVLTYAIPNDEEKLLVLFYKEKFLGQFRERASDSLDRTIENHEFHQSGKIMLFQSWFNGETTYFYTDKSALQMTPQWTTRSWGEPPLTKAQAESLAFEWLKTNPPGHTARVLRAELHDVLSLKGYAFYIVRVDSSLRELVVLMDDTIITGRKVRKP